MPSPYTQRTIILACSVGGGTAVLVAVLVLSILLCRRWYRQKKRNEELGQREETRDSAWSGAYPGVDQRVLSFGASTSPADHSQQRNIPSTSASTSRVSFRDSSLVDRTGEASSSVSPTSSQAYEAEEPLQCSSEIADNLMLDARETNEDYYNPMPANERAAAISLVNVKSAKLSPAIKSPSTTQALQPSVRPKSLPARQTKQYSMTYNKSDFHSSIRRSSELVHDTKKSSSRCVSSLQVGGATTTRHSLEEDFGITIYPAYHQNRAEPTSRTHDNRSVRTWHSQGLPDSANEASTSRLSSHKYVYASESRSSTKKTSFTRVT